MNKESDPHRRQGILNEERFFRVLREAEDQGKLPDWIVDLRRAARYEDQAGVDGLVLLQEVNSEEIWKVPFQIKSSTKGVNVHKQKNSVFWMDDLRYFIIHPRMTDEEITGDFVKKMTAIHRRKERFPRVLALLEERRLLELEREKKKEQRMAPAINASRQPVRISWWQKPLHILQKIFRR